jgi:hypothetical protein
MSLKYKKPSTPPEPESVNPDAWNGPWGKINPISETFDVIRFCQGTAGRNLKTHSYPFRMLSSWHWTQEPGEEQLRIKAATDLITVKGRGLERIVEALDRGTLELLCEEADLPKDDTRIISISRIEIESPIGEED